MGTVPIAVVGTAPTGTVPPYPGGSSRDCPRVGDCPSKRFLASCRYRDSPLRGQSLLIRDALSVRLRAGAVRAAEAEPHSRTAAFCSLGADAAAVRLRDLLHDREPEPEPGSLRAAGAR
jgi:hypothetical protein